MTYLAWATAMAFAMFFLNFELGVAGIFRRAGWIPKLVTFRVVSAAETAWGVCATTAEEVEIV